MAKTTSLKDLVRRLDDHELDAALASALKGDFGAVEARLSTMAKRGVVEIPKIQLRGVALPGKFHLSRSRAGKMGRAASPWGSEGDLFPGLPMVDPKRTRRDEDGSS